MSRAITVGEGPMDWAHVRQKLPQDARDMYLIKFLKFLEAVGCVPGDVQRQLKPFADELKRRNYQSTRSRANRAARRYNTYVAPLGFPTLKELSDESSASAAYKALPEPVRDAIERHLAAKSEVSSGTLKSYRRVLHRIAEIIAEAKIRVAVPEDILSTEVVGAVHDAFGPPSRFAHGRLELLYALSGLAGSMGAIDAKAMVDKILKTLRDRAKGAQLEMPSYLVDFVCAFDAPGAFQAVVEGLDSIIAQLERPQRARSDYGDAQDAVGALILLSTCKDRNFLSKVRFAGEIRERIQGPRPVLIDEGGAEVEVLLPDELRERIDLLYAVQLRDRGFPPQRLFETFAGARRGVSAISDGLSSALARVVKESRLLGEMLAGIKKPAPRKPEAARKSARENAEKTDADGLAPLTLSPSYLTPIAIYWLMAEAPQLQERSLASLAGYTSTAACLRYYRPILGLRVSVKFAEALGFSQEKTSHDESTRVDTAPSQEGRQNIATVRVPPAGRSQARCRSVQEDESCAGR